MSAVFSQHHSVIFGVLGYNIVCPLILHKPHMLSTVLISDVESDTGTLYCQGEIGLPGEPGEPGFQGDKVFKLAVFTFSTQLFHC